MPSTWDKPAACVIVPGYGDSGPDHWQSLWERRLGAIRVVQDDWHAAEPQAWSARVAATVAMAGDGVLVVAHSLGCLATALADPQAMGRVRGALLVAPPDPAGPAFPRSVRGDWSARGRLAFPALVVYSTDDPYADEAFSRRRAEDWGAGSVCVGAAGHINADSGLGGWDAGLELLRRISGG